MPIIKDNKNLFTLDKDASGAQRKMAAIFAADVVGYSKLMAENEKLTLFRLKETRKITDKIINSLNGRIFSTAGDSIMAEFASPVDAMEAAISIQNEVSKNLLEIKDNIKIKFRVGINLGDIMFQDNNLYGDNVNIAARLESIATPGEICISEKVYHEVHNKVECSFKLLGEKKLKNINQRVKVYTTFLTQESDLDGISKITFSLSKRKILIIIASLCVLFFGLFFLYNTIFPDRLEYTENSKSVLENFRSTQDSNATKNDVVNDGKVIISFMQLQNQSGNLDNDSIKDLQLLISNNLSTAEKIAIVNSPEGSENLNPPEVMLIATESNASFVINGIVFDEGNNNFLNLKIYESKRGSLILNQKILLNEENSNLLKFISKFADDVTNN